MNSWCHGVLLDKFLTLSECQENLLQELKDEKELAKWKDIRQAGQVQELTDMGKDTACMPGPWKQMRENNKARMIVNAGHHPPVALYNRFIFLHGEYLDKDNLEP